MFRFLIICLMSLPIALSAQEREPLMTPDRMFQIALALDPDARPLPNGIEMTIEDVPVLIVADIVANRMRAMVPIRLAEGMTPEELERVLQANFDTALDSRYALANGRLWAVYIHPFAQLERDQFISGIAQTVNIANSYGTLFSGGAAQFGAGDLNLARAIVSICSAIFCKSC
ncbi:hypothetical protein SAMN05444003_1693 [Cognatiyoonia sediminum]|uniref:Uncharacterized protein n=1 Tax=Cognatiyoonia sediminum TaxID=1508389 RepID=A0A1M5PKD5_9RHOB|nr:hypothetical protein [Cognatiyoonia sediminum]SHH02211.1 hypothetical protein SAMN05444003_1693 [Cognatiyoonia sediminum]